MRIRYRKMFLREKTGIVCTKLPFFYKIPTQKQVINASLQLNCPDFDVKQLFFSSEYGNSFGRIQAVYHKFCQHFLSPHRLNFIHEKMMLILPKFQQLWLQEANQR